MAHAQRGLLSALVGLVGCMTQHSRVHALVSGHALEACQFSSVVRLDGNCSVEEVEPWGVRLRSGERLRADTVFWAAGVTGSPLLHGLSPELELDRQGRAWVREDCSLPGYGEVFVIGDAACCFGAQGSALPSLSAVARQAGSYVGKLISLEVANPKPNTRVPFVYVDKGQMVTLGRGRALAQRQRKQLGGRAAWWAGWLGHIYDSIGFGNRAGALIRWASAYVRFGRGARVITADGSPALPSDAALSEPTLGETERLFTKRTA